jgi:O-acetyl-ADP-ribose deacetylase (regulator of RNase III)
MNYKINNTVVELLKGNIADMETEAIVNAANSMLIMGGGVAGAIAAKGGPTIQVQCSKYGGTPVGTAVVTTGGNLKARYVIHAVGPRMGEGDEDRKLESATLNSLKLADDGSLASIAFPAISTGIFGFPVDRCSKIMMDTTKKYLPHGKTKLQKVVFCLYDDETYGNFEKEMKTWSN